VALVSDFPFAKPTLLLARFAPTRLVLESGGRTAMKRVLVVVTFVLLANAPAVVAAAAAPPTTPTPVSLTVKKKGSSEVVRVKVTDLTHADASLIRLEVDAKSPAGKFGVLQNDPAFGYTVNPYDGNGKSNGPAKVKITKHTMTFTFSLKAIGSPSKGRVRAFQAGEGDTPGPGTPWKPLAL
jgi:hypothetical protein